MKKCFWLFSVVSLLTAVADGSQLTVTCRSLSAMFDSTQRGACVGLVSSGGTEFAASGRKPVQDLFTVAVRNVGAYTNRVAVSSAKAHAFWTEPIADGVRLVYSDFGQAPLEEVVCTVRGSATDDRLRWRISARPKSGWAVCEMTYPCLAITGKIGESGEDDAILSGRSFSSGLRRNLGKKGFGVDATQPGDLAVQMLCYYDPKALLLYACEDARGEVKRLHGSYNARKRSLDLNWTWLGWSECAVELPYDVITAAVEAKPGDDPLTWHDGADLYRTWAVKQRFCHTAWKNREDLPKWLRSFCAYAGLSAFAGLGGSWRSWVDHPGALERWAKEYWAAKYPNARVALHFDGWEKDGIYVMTEYFPLYPDDRKFTAMMRDLREARVVPFPWPSGYRRADAYNRRPDGSFETDERAEFNRRFLPMACKLPDGSRAVEKLRWLNGGTASFLCGGDPRTISWFSREVCSALTERGVPAVACDQNIGGAFPACWDRSHPHTPGFGAWKTESIRRQSVEALAALREKFPDDAIFCYEEPNEQINDTVTCNYSREAYKPEREWTGLFNYLYHEYAPSFPIGGKTTYARAYCAANGLMPRVEIDCGDIACGESIFPNGGFEELAADGRSVMYWESGPGTAPNAVVDDECHSGKRSLRIERAPGTNAWRHVARNFASTDDAFAEGRRCRLSSWIKVARGAIRADLGFFNVGGGACGWANVATGAADAKKGEWRYYSQEFNCPTGSFTMVRLMLNAKPGSQGWIDDIALDEVLSDGSVRPLVYRGAGRKDAFQKRWIALYGGEGREWLAYGRRVKPPVIECAQIVHGGRTVPAVHIGAYVSLQGERAWVLANGTDAEQSVRWRHAGRAYSRILPPRGLELVRTINGN